MSKKNSSYSLAGNRIDRALRNCRDRQTIGVPIGPDSSLIIAELILSEIDELLSQRCRSLKAIRYVDDYEFTFDTHHHAEDVIGILQEVLAEYELELNPRKTEILGLPVPHEYKWVSELRSLPLRPETRIQSSDLIKLFDRAFDYAKESPGEPILRYLMGRLKGFSAQNNCARLYQHLLLQCVTVESGTILYAIGHIIDQSTRGISDSKSIEETLNNFISFHAPLGHHNEVCWAIWGLIVLQLNLHDKARKALEQVDDSMVILLALHAEREGRISTSIDKTYWQSLMTEESLYGGQWLLAYEALVRKWLPSANGKDYVASDPFFNTIKTLGIHFYKEEAVKKVKLSGIPPSLGIAPTFYV